MRRFLKTFAIIVIGVRSNKFLNTKAVEPRTVFSFVLVIAALGPLPEAMKLQIESSEFKGMRQES